MPDEATIPKNGEDTITGQAPPPQSADAAGQVADTQAPPPQSGDTATGQASEPEQFSSENLTGEPVTPPASEPVRVEPTPASDIPPPETDAPSVRGETVEKGEEKGETTTTPSQSPPSYHPQGSPSLERRDGGEVRRGDLAVANAKIQEAKRKKLDKIMAVLEGKGPPTLKLRRVNAITNDEVEKLLRVSDATATRFLQTLEQENRIKQNGSTGTGVFYEKI